MNETCHRCGGDLPSVEAASESQSHFCPHCGAPQLILSDYSEALSTGVDPQDDAGNSSTGTLPPPRPNRIDWPMALRGSIFVSAVSALFSVIAAAIPGFSPVGSVWVVSASLTTLALYQRRRPLAAMNASVGAKIGLLVGITLVFFLGATLSAGLCIARFSLHVMTSFDTKLALAMKAQVDQLAASRPIDSESLSLINSLQFRAAWMLSTFSLLLFAILLVSVFGGAVGGLLRTRRFGRKV